MVDDVVQVRELWRFPVKSLQGERLEAVEVDAFGVVGDRRYGIVDARTGHVLSAKLVPELFEASAVTEPAGAPGGRVKVTMADGEAYDADDPALAVRLGSWLGREVRVREVSRSDTYVYDMTFDPPDDGAEKYEIPAPPGTFLDLAAMHVLSTASLAALETEAPDMVWDVRRFRPNVVVAGVSASFGEDDWVGSTVQIGDVVVAPFMRTMRCAMPLRAQPAAPEVGSPVLERRREMYRILVDVHANDLGVYCSVESPGRIAVGDPVVAL